MNKTTIIIAYLLLFGTSGLMAQVNQQQLLGEWRLDAMLGKQITANEKQKRYIFTPDSIFYTSIRKNAKAPYTLQPQTGQCLWYIPELPKPLAFSVKYLHADTLQLWEQGENPIIGVMVRISEEGKTHYQKALDAQKAKKFDIAFAELAKAAQKDHPDAMYQLGMYYFTGVGTTLDEKEGSKWIRAAANMGNKQAQAIVNSNSLRY